MNTYLKSACFGLLAVSAAGCTDLKPLQADLDSLKSQVSKLQSEVQTNAAQEKTDSSNNERAAAAAQQTAQSASAKSDQALALAQANSGKIDAIDEKLNRMFKRSLSK